MRSQKFRHSYYYSTGRYRFKNYYKIGSKYGKLLPSGFYDTQTWGALEKCWLGYIIAKNKGENDKQIHYASIIQKLQRELDLEVSSFPALNLYVLDEEEDNDDNKLAGENCSRGVR
jgi:hypothetical protein